MNIDPVVTYLAEQLLAQGKYLAVAESCTGGLVAATCTALAGSSQWFERGFVTYSNQAKQELLQVSQTLLLECGAVSQEVAEAMALGAVQNSAANLAVAITGIAGPGGGSDDKPVGTVWFAAATDQGMLRSQCTQLQGNRAQVREQAVVVALELACSMLNTENNHNDEEEQ